MTEKQTQTTTDTKTEPKKADVPPARKAPTKFRDPAEMFKNKNMTTIKTGE